MLRGSRWVLDEGYKGEMALTLVRFAIRSLILVVALVALNLAGARARLDERWRGGASLFAKGNLFQRSEGRVEYGVACRYGPAIQETGGYEALLREVWRLPKPPTSLQVRWSVIASASLTVVILILYSWNWGALPGGAPPRSGVGLRFLVALLWIGTRWTVLAIALVALNVACAVYQPLFDLYEPKATSGPDTETADPASQRPRLFELWISGECTARARRSAAARVPAWVYLRSVAPPAPGWVDLQVDCHDLFDGIPRVLNVAIDGTLVERCAMEVEGRTQKRLPEVIFQDSPIGEGTIDFIADGSIVGFQGRPGKMLSRPRLLRPPSFSFLEWRWPLIGSASITLLVLFITLRRLSRRQLGGLVIASALAGINIAGALACLPREPPRLLSETWGMAGEGELYYSDGTRLFYEGKGLGAQGNRVTRIIRPKPPPFLQTWWPVIAGPSITVVVLGVIWRRARQRRARPPKGVDTASTA